MEDATGRWHELAMVDTDSGGGIAGSIGEAEGPNQVTFYIEVDDRSHASIGWNRSAARPRFRSPRSRMW